MVSEPPNASHNRAARERLEYMADVDAAPVDAIVMPFYEKDGVTIYVGDCRTIIPMLPAVDAVITDPPYNGGYGYGEKVDDRQSRSDYQGWWHSWFWWLKRKT